jgi:hypothetical protein
MCPSWNESFEGDILLLRFSLLSLMMMMMLTRDEVTRRCLNSRVGGKYIDFLLLFILASAACCLSRANNKTQVDEMKIEFQMLMTLSWRRRKRSSEKI